MREKVLVNIFKIVCIAVFAGQSYYSLVQTGYSPLDLADEAVYFKKDNVFINILSVIIVIAILLALKYLTDKLEMKLNTRILAISAAFLTMAVGFLWVYGSNVAPQADSWNVSFYADAFNDGDYTGFGKGKYIATCPHQLGIVTILRMIYKILGPNRYVGFQLLSVACLGIIVYVGYELVRRFSNHNVYAEVVYLILCVLCFPLYGYTPFVYGEIPSTAVLFIGAWVLLDGLDCFRWYKALVVMICAGLSVQLRQNSLIVLIGFVVLLIVKAVQRFEWKLLMLTIAIITGFVGSNVAIDAIYGKYFQEDGQPIPNVLYIAMGTQWKEENAGWFSGYNYSVFFENDCDPEMASRVAYKDIENFLQKCLDNKGYAIDFLGNKILAQWNEPMYQVLVMNQNIQAEQAPIIADIYFGSLRSVVEEYMNIYQLIIYGSILGLFILNFKKWDKIEPFVLMIGIFGGFLFTIIWEAKTRYVFPYFIMMLPYAAVGLQRVINKLEEANGYIFHKNVRK